MPLVNCAAAEPGPKASDAAPSTAGAANQPTDDADASETSGRWLPIDEDGWTVLTPARDTRLIYVSSSTGDDAAARAYAPVDPAVGPDPFKPGEPVKAFKTFSAAMGQARDEHPDWVLLKRGDTWREGLGTLPDGRSPTEPFVVSAYGQASERPRLLLGRKGTAPPWSFGSRTGRHDVAVVSLELYADTKDPKSPTFSTAQKGGSVGISVLTRPNVSARRILIEDCCLRYCGAVVMATGGPVEQIVFRRNLVLGNYSHTGHSQGMFANKASMLLEENVFDHNGWLVQGLNNRTAGGGATMFNHNTYFSSCHDVVFRGNMFLRASSAGNKWTANYGPGSARNLLIDDNLYVEGEIGIGIGGNKTGPLRFANVRITNNVFLDIGRGQPTQRTLAWYLDILDWDGGTVANNLFVHQAAHVVSNTYAIHLGSHSNKGRYRAEGVHCRNVTIRDNIIHGLKSGGSTFILSQVSRLRNITIASNQLQFPGLQTRLIRADAASPAECTFKDNVYFTGRDPSQWFSIGRQERSFDAWTAEMGETGAARGEIPFPDPSRTVETYNASLGGEATFEAFLTEVKKQSKTNWRPQYTASAVNDYVRAGFGLERCELPPPPSDADPRLRDEEPK